MVRRLSPARALSAPVPPQGPFTPELRDFVAATLTKKPSERPSAHQLLSHALFRSVQPSASLQERIAQHVQERAARIAEDQGLEGAPAGTGTIRAKREAEAPEWEFSMRRSRSQPVRRGGAGAPGDWAQARCMCESGVALSFTLCG